MSSRRNRYLPVKRAIDIGASAVLLLLTFPVQAVVAGLVAIRLGRPVLFRQPRPGRDERIFTLLKFRTMLPQDPERGLETDEQRLTSLGRVLRSASLDELPSLWNVLFGHMSLVGPRPLLVEYLPLYSAEQARRHEVRPGITGLAQVSGRNALSWPDKFSLDVHYVDNLSAGMDLRIVVDTIRAVLTREGISEEGKATMSRFEGNRAD